jgi:selenocysteine lyase/cysteine desulfurase
MTNQSDRIVWRSPQDWELSASLFALEIQETSSQAAFEQMYGEHGFVFRAFRAQGLNTVRISPNVYNTEEEIERFFQVASALPRG